MRVATSAWNSPAPGGCAGATRARSANEDHAPTQAARNKRDASALFDPPRPSGRRELARLRDVGAVQEASQVFSRDRACGVGTGDTLNCDELTPERLGSKFPVRHFAEVPIVPADRRFRFGLR